MTRKEQPSTGLFFWIGLLLAGCGGINETQHRQITFSLDCYLQMHEQLIKPAAQRELAILSYQYFPQATLPFYIPDVKYSLIPRDVIFELLKMEENNDCRQKLDSLGDFAGVRFVNSKFISYDVCRIPQSSGKYGGGHS